MPEQNFKENASTFGSELKQSASTFWSANKKAIILFSIVAIGLIILILVLFKNKPLDKEYERKVAEKEQIIKQLQEARKQDSLLLINLRNKVAYHESRDSILVEKERVIVKYIEVNKNKQNDLKKDYEKISDSVNNMSKDELRDALSELYDFD